MSIRSYIGKNSTVKGDLKVEEDVLLEGCLEGSLYSTANLILGLGSWVKGHLRAEEAAISGELYGSVRCARKLEILRSARINGTVQAPVIRMEAGAWINGQVLMSTAEPETPEASVPEESLLAH